MRPGWITELSTGKAGGGMFSSKGPGLCPSESTYLRNSPHPPSSGARMKPWICTFTRRSRHVRSGRSSRDAPNPEQAPRTRVTYLGQSVPAAGLAPKSSRATSLPQGRSTIFFSLEIENRPGPSGSGGAQIFFFRHRAIHAPRCAPHQGNE